MPMQQHALLARRAMQRAKEGLRRYLLSPHFKLGTQLAVAVLIASLFTYVKALRFSHCCLVPNLLLICLISLSPDDPNVGTELQAALFLLAESWYGTLLAGVMGTLAKLAQPDDASGQLPASYVALLCVMASIGLAVLALPRAGGLPLWPHLQMGALIYTLVLVQGEPTMPIARFWRDDVCGMLLVGVVAAGISALCAVMVLPTMASQEAIQLTSRVVRDSGHSLKRYVSAVLAALPQSAAAACSAADSSTGNVGSTPSQGGSMTAHNGGTHDSNITDNSTGNSNTSYRGSAPSSTAQTALHVAADAQDSTSALCVGTEAEGSAVATRPLARDVETGTLQTCASLSFEDDAVVTEDGLVTLVPYQVNPAARRRARVVHHKPQGVQLLHARGGAYLLLGPLVSELRPKLARARQCVDRAGFEPAFMCPGGKALDVPGWMSILSATETLLNRSAALEELVLAGVSLTDAPHHAAAADAFKVVLARVVALCAQLSSVLADPSDSRAASRWRQAAAGRSWDGARAQLARRMDETMASYWARVQAAQADHPTRITRMQQARALMFTWVLTEGVMEAAEALDAAVENVLGRAEAQAGGNTRTASCDVGTAQAQQPKQQRSIATGSFGHRWPSVQQLRRAVETIALLSLWRNTWLVLTRVLPRLLPWRPGAGKLLQDRSVQAAFKFWLAMSLLMVLTLSLYPVTSDVVQGPVLGITAAVLSWHDRVESTRIRVVLRTVGTAAGATLGLAAMATPGLANNPYALTAIMCVAVFLLAPLAAPSFHLRLATALTGIGVTSTILCQYAGCCGHTGSTLLYGVRVLEAALGCLWSGIFNLLLLPWSTSDWALESMAGVFNTSAELLSQMNAVQFNIHSQAAESNNDNRSKLSCGSNSEHCMTMQAGAPLQSQPCSLKPAPAPAAQQQQQQTALQGPEQFREVLHTKLSAPLVAVQTTLRADTQLWGYGKGYTLAPQVVHQLLGRMFALFDRLVAVHMALAALPTMQAAAAAAEADDNAAEAPGTLPRPATAHNLATEVVTEPGLVQPSPGAASATAGTAVVGAACTRPNGGNAWVFDHLVQPMHGQQALVLSSIEALAGTVAAQLVQPSEAGHNAIKQQIELVEQQWQDAELLLQSLRKDLHHRVHQSRRARLQSLPASASAPELRQRLPYETETGPQRLQQAQHNGGTPASAADGVVDARQYMQHMAFMYALRQAVQQSISVAHVVVDHHAELMHQHHKRRRLQKLLHCWHR